MSQDNSGFVMVPCGAFRMAVNILRRAGKDEVADQLENDSSRGSAPAAERQDGDGEAMRACIVMTQPGLGRATLEIDSPGTADWLDPGCIVFVTSRAPAAKDASPAPDYDDDDAEPTPMQIEYGRGFGDGVKHAEEILAKATPAPAPAVSDAKDAERWFACYSEVIKEIAAMATVQTSDILFDLNAVPRDSILDHARRIKDACDKFDAPYRAAIPRRSAIAARAEVSP